MKAGNSTSQRRSNPVGTITAALIAITLIAGCQSGDSGADSSGVASLGGSSKESTITPGMMIPSLPDLTGELSLTNQQAVLLGVALDAWSTVAEERHALREQRREDRKMGERHRWDGDGNTPDRNSPLKDFLVAGAEILSTDQFVALTDILKEKREAIHAEREARRTDRQFGQRGKFEHKRGDRGGRGGFGGTMYDELNLTDEQQVAIDAARNTMRETMQALRPERGAGEQPDREAMQAAREKLRETIDGILTPEQLTQREEARNTRREEMQVKHQERAADRMENQLAFLTALLDLDASQVAAITTIFADAQSERQSLHDAARQDSAGRDRSLFEERQKIREATQTAIRAILSADQVMIFDAVQDLLPGNGKGRGQRGFRGHGMIDRRGTV